MLIWGHVLFHVLLCRDDDHCFGPETVLAHLMQMRPKKDLRCLMGVTEKQRNGIQLLFALSDVRLVCNLLDHVEQEEHLQPVSPTWQDAVRDSTHFKPTKAIFSRSHMHSEVLDSVLIPFITRHSLFTFSKVFIFFLCLFTTLCTPDVT